MQESGNKFTAKTIGNQWCRPAAILIGALLSLFVVSNGIAAGDSDKHQVGDLHYGQALYQYFQQNDLAAIIQLMVAEKRPLSTEAKNEAQLLLADLYYGYELFQDSQQLFAQLLSAELSGSILNRIWFNLARLNYDQGHYDNARDLLSRIDDQLPVAIEDERNYMLSNLYLGNQQYQQAGEFINNIAKESIWKLYAQYNLAVAMLEDERYADGREILLQLGQMRSTSDEILALRDQANLSLALKQLRMQQAEIALANLSRIRIQGPVSNDALLATGWARHQLGEFNKALIPWRLLLGKNAVDTATQEAILAIPSNYEKSGQNKLAIQHYENAATQFGLQLQLLDNAIATINNNGLVVALEENALVPHQNNFEQVPPQTAVTAQLHQLLASKHFHQEIKRLQQLYDIRNSLNYWNKSVPVLELMLKERRASFQQKKPLLEKTNNFERLANLSNDRERFANHLAQIETSESFLELANSDEKEQLQRLEKMAASIEKIGTQQNTQYQKDMHRLLRGILHWTISTDFAARFWKAKKQLIGLDRALVIASNKADTLRQITEQTSLNFINFQARINGQEAKISTLGDRVESLISRQYEKINLLAITEIQDQQQHIIQLRLGTRFALARLYDKLATQQ